MSKKSIIFSRDNSHLSYFFDYFYSSLDMNDEWEEIITELQYLGCSFKMIDITKLASDSYNVYLSLLADLKLDASLKNWVLIKDKKHDIVGLSKDLGNMRELLNILKGNKPFIILSESLESVRALFDKQGQLELFNSALYIFSKDNLDALVSRIISRDFSPLTSGESVDMLGCFYSRVYAVIYHTEVSDRDKIDKNLFDEYLRSVSFIMTLIANRKMLKSA